MAKAPETLIKKVAQGNWELTQRLTHTPSQSARIDARHTPD